MPYTRFLWPLLAVLIAACSGEAHLTPIGAPPGAATPTRIALAAPLPTATATPTPTGTPPPSGTPTATPLPTPTVSRTPLATLDAAQLAAAFFTPVPTMMPPVETEGVTVVLLIGADTTNPDDIGRTDTLLLIALHHATNTATLLAIPRDLFVYVPTWGMARINTAYSFGERTGYPGGGPGLLRDTILYNLGIYAPYHARTDFNGFASLIDALDGIDLSVPCPVQDWILQPEGDLNDADDWAMLTLPVGVHHLDGRTTLWYVRSRRGTTDLDRGRRQQDVMRAVGRRARDLGWLEALPATWDEVAALVETNLTPDVLGGLVPLALTLKVDHVERLTFTIGTHVRDWTTPDGQAVLLPDGEAVAHLATSLLTPPSENQIVNTGVRVEVINRAGQPDLAQVAADRLAWLGLAATYDDSGGGDERARTLIIDYTGRTKDTPLAVLQREFGVDDEDVIVRPDPEREVDFVVALGRDYDPCR